MHNPAQIPPTAPSVAAEEECSPALQSLSELAMLSVEDLPNDRPEWELHLYCPLDQLMGYEGLGAKGGIVLSTLEVVHRGVRFDLQWILEPLLSLHRAYRNHPVGYLAYTSQVLLAHVGGGITDFSVAALVYEQSTTANRSRLGVI